MPDSDVDGRVQVAVELFVRERNSLLLTPAAPGGERRFTEALDEVAVSLGVEAQAQVGEAVEKLSAMRLLLEDMGEVYHRAVSEVLVLEFSDREDGAHLVTYRETTKLYYRPDEFRPEYTAYSAVYEAVFQRGDGLALILESIDLVGEPGMPPITEPARGTVPASEAELIGLLNDQDSRVSEMGVDDAPDPILQPDGSLRPVDAGLQRRESLTRSSPFMIDVPAASFYAWVHWDNYHSGSISYSNDCANFVSQILSYGGWSHENYPGSWGAYGISAWWYDDHPGTSSDYSYPTWRISDYRHSFARLDRTSSRNGIYNMVEGDFSVMDWKKDGHKDHTWYTHERSWINSSGHIELYLTYHTTDTFKRSVGSILAQLQSEHGGSWWYAQDSATASNYV